jgi:hypothetical protein
MNGRLFDYQLGRFLGVDPVIQFPTNSQSLNPYSYILNNPLAGKDPSGYAIDCTDSKNCTLSDVQRLAVYPDKDGKYYAIATDNKGNMVRAEAIVNGTPKGSTATLLNQTLLSGIANKDPSAIASISSRGLDSSARYIGSNYNKELGNQHAADYFGGFMGAVAKSGAISAACGTTSVGAAACLGYGLGQLQAGDKSGLGLVLGGAIGGLARTTSAVTRTAAEEAGSIRNINTIGGDLNCVNCAIATDAMLAGRPASALGGGPYSIDVLKKLFGRQFSPPASIAHISDEIASAGPGARGIIFGSRGSGEVGHVFNVVNQNGTVRFLDGQSGGVAATNGYTSFQLLRTN